MADLYCKSLRYGGVAVFLFKSLSYCSHILHVQVFSMINFAFYSQWISVCAKIYLFLNDIREIRYFHYKSELVLS